MCVVWCKYGSEMNVVGDLFLVFVFSFYWVSELNFSDVNFFLKNIQFDGRFFIFLKLIKLENGFLYVIGCDWKLNDEIIIVD